MDLVDDLVLTPFKEIVDKAQTAVDNAGDDNPDMLKASQTLLKEGQRALKRIEPICKKHFEEYGTNFTDALKENDEIAQYRSELNDFLWEFDDYIEVDEFDPDEFTKLQKLSRKAAPRVYDIIMRMKLEPAPRDATPLSPTLSAAAPVPPAPPAQPSPSDSGLSSPVKGRRSANSDIGDPNGMPPPPLETMMRRPIPSRTTPPPMAPLPMPPPRRSLPATPVEAEHSGPAEFPVPPVPPTLNPWDIKTKPSTINHLQHATRPPSLPERRRPHAPTQADLALLPHIDVQPLMPDMHLNPRYSQMLQDAQPRHTHTLLAQELQQRRSPTPQHDLQQRHSQQSNDAQQRHSQQSNDGQQRHSQQSNDAQQRHSQQSNDAQQRHSQQSNDSHQTFSQPPLSPTSITSSQPLNESPTLGMAQPAIPQYARARMVGFPPTSHRPLDHSIPEHDEVDGNGYAFVQQPQQYGDRNYSGSSHPVTSLSRQHSGSDSFRSSVYGTNSSTGDNRTSGTSVSVYGTNSSIGDHHTSGHSANEGSVGSPVFSQGPTPGTPASPRDSGGLQVVPMASRENEGLIPVEPDKMTQGTPLPTRPARDTSITLSSSFYVMKGFCEGAKEVMRGELGVKKVKKPTFMGSQLTAKCTHCFYELDWKEIELDINQSNDANFAIGDVGFRIRFLQKSHLPTRRADEALYGCVFCIQEGHTSQDGDATVFFSQRELCEHLARHSRPLPHVGGVTVVDEPTIPLGMRTSYDVHLRVPPAPSALDDKWDEIAMRPTVTAKETVKKMYGMKLLHDRTPAFELAVGAKIIGVEFPEQYNGEWCMGYHEGKYASFPFEVARLEPPPPHELRMGGTSTVKAVARWKFVAKDKSKAEWLKFDKGDVISNINWSDRDHWCWSGTNSKGKWGIFPKSHLDLQTLRETEDSDRSSTLSGAASVKPKSILGRMTSSRKSDERPETPKIPKGAKGPKTEKASKPSGELG
ncbi:uncharacterized protein DNG_02476 [Cephalotrichum gorgonifer]|uniref:SH3 domain-containing protein n=1 Tax=Cephalotrichum gorgonifer TaxID=2041049 RepID=A0AAE8MTB3_9PEZI|nr:uncharacterized protein DNG_02476 [Cephalotrichum gorgonifer]